MEEYDEKVHQVTKSLEKLIGLDLLTLNPHINLEFIYQTIMSDLNQWERDMERSEKVRQMMETMQKYFPDVFDYFLEKKGKE